MSNRSLHRRPSPSVIAPPRFRVLAPPRRPLVRCSAFFFRAESSRWRECHGTSSSRPWKGRLCWQSGTRFSRRRVEWPRRRCSSKRWVHSTGMVGLVDGSDGDPDLDLELLIRGGRTVSAGRAPGPQPWAGRESRRQARRPPSCPTRRRLSATARTPSRTAHDHRRR